MTARYLVDTDWAINYLNGQAVTTARLQALQPDGLALSVVSLAELYEGVFYSTKPEENERALQGFLSVVEVLGVDDAVARRFGKERGRLRAASLMIGDADLLWHNAFRGNSLSVLRLRDPHHFGFQDRWFQPLTHPSTVASSNSCSEPHRVEVRGAYGAARSRRSILGKGTRGQRFDRVSHELGGSAILAWLRRFDGARACP